MDKVIVVTALAVLIPAFLTLQFLVMGRLIARWSGWRALALHWLDPLGRTRLTQFGWQSARWSEGTFRPGYNSCLSLAVEPTGLGLRLTLPIIPAHPPLFVPWTEISEVRPGRSWLGNTFAVTFLAANATLVFSGDAGERLYVTWYAQRRDLRSARR